MPSRRALIRRSVVGAYCPARLADQYSLIASYQLSYPDSVVRSDIISEVAQASRKGVLQLLFFYLGDFLPELLCVFGFQLQAVSIIPTFDPHEFSYLQ